MLAAHTTRKGAAMSDPAEHLEMLRGIICDRGWAVVHADDRRFVAHTVGLADLRLPEVLVTGLLPRRAHHLLNTVADHIVGNGAPAAGARMSLPDGTQLEFVAVAAPDVHLPLAAALFGSRAWALQAVWADRRGRWPWAADFNEGGRRQPVLGVRANA
jgi:hypothetical protein